MMNGFGHMRQYVMLAGIAIVGLGSAPAPAHEWHNLSTANYGAFSVDLKGATWVGRVVTYQTLFKQSKMNKAVDHTIGTAAIDCQTRRRKGIYSTEYLRNGKKNGGSIDAGWRPIYPGTVSDSIRKLLCGGD